MSKLMPKYKITDNVIFKFGDQQTVGTIEVVDVWGPNENECEVSYDIYTDCIIINGERYSKMLIKHIPEENIISLA